ncbi:hypothetical protein [Methanolacinia petrolearia]|uniref:hypothetical protein n=1 Tax=Methanolacinia petrolearia TaxID=54120 RepID=UPI003BAA1CAC
MGFELIIENLANNIGAIVGSVFGAIAGVIIGYYLENLRDNKKQTTEMKILKQQIIREMNNSLFNFNSFLNIFYEIDEKDIDENTVLAYATTLKTSNFFGKLYFLEDPIRKFLDFSDIEVYEVSELNEEFYVFMNHIRLFEETLNRELIEDFSKFKKEIEDLHNGLKRLLMMIEKN